MDYTIDTATDTCTITCTGADLVRMEALDLAIYATPTPQGLANQLYMSSRPNFKYDFLIADSGDFLEEMGIDTLDWQDSTQEEVEAMEEDIGEVTIIVSRAKAVPEEP